MRANGLLLIVAIVACAPAGPAPPRSDGVIRVGGNEGTSILATGSISAPGIATITAPIDAIWQALPAVYDSLGIPRNTLDVPSRTIGNTGYLTRRTLGKTRLSDYIDCGSPQMRPAADYYDVNLSVLTQLQSESSGATKVTTTLVASAKSPSFSGQFDRCASTGRLETKLFSLLDAQLKR